MPAPAPRLIGFLINGRLGRKRFLRVAISSRDSRSANRHVRDVRHGILGGFENDASVLPFSRKDSTATCSDSRRKAFNL